MMVPFRTNVILTHEGADLFISRKILVLKYLMTLHKTVGYRSNSMLFADNYELFLAMKKRQGKTGQLLS